MRARLYTVGHSARPLEELEQVLRVYDIGVLADVRRFPRSRRNPQFNDELLSHSLHQLGVQYVSLTTLGGRRASGVPGLANAGWRNPSFRAFADYMQSREFDKDVSQLIGLARYQRLAMMSAETLPWRCHRSLIADALVARGFQVVHILDDRQTKSHRLTSFARVDRGKVTYPAST